MLGNSLEVVSLTDAGKVRTYNEDALVADAENGIVVLADGMGGHRAGEVASRMAVDAVSGGLKAKVTGFRSGVGHHSQLHAVDQVVSQANETIFKASKSRRDAQGRTYEGMGTTLAMAVFFNNRVTLGHIGDSRIYRLRDDRLQLLTRDDSLLRDQVELGMISAEDARESHNRNLVTKALGIEERVSAQLREELVSPEDIFLLCTDGLTDLVEDADIELIVSTLKSNLPLAAAHLIQTANDYGGYDNVSVILVKVRESFPITEQKGWTSKLFGWMK
ncbi:MAG TPA: protein phosphatase 2C domain-containing protein [Burkholderiales bacterium]|nr:protein phosphatase 2C domain-containing protein [Burkholderiales bacterium]